jgi:hypothetical protein
MVRCHCINKEANYPTLEGSPIEKVHLTASPIFQGAEHLMLEIASESIKYNPGLNSEGQILLISYRGFKKK